VEEFEMGQKVNPLSMRLQLNKDWRSKWFAGRKDYATYLRQDLTARKLIEDKLGSRAAINKVDIERSPNLVTVTIQTAKAGVVIGRGGTGASELKVDIEKIYGVPVRVNIEEIKRAELQAKLVAENIAHQLERRIAFRRAVKQAASAAMRAGARGVRIEISGRLGGNEMSRREKEIQGSVPLGTLRADVDYASARALYPGAGIIGVKVWICRGETNV
jgi:small subunit ribosomal protein S3